jgi:hypothetical protein
MPRRRGSARGVASADASIVFPSHCFGRPSFPQAGFDPLAYHCALKLSERAGDLENELAHKRCRVDGLLTRRYKSTPQASRCLIGSRKSLSDRPRRSIAPISNFRRLASLSWNHGEARTHGGVCPVISSEMVSECRGVAHCSRPINPLGKE